MIKFKATYDELYGIMKSMDMLKDIKGDFGKFHYILNKNKERIRSSLKPIFKRVIQPPEKFNDYKTEFAKIEAKYNPRVRALANDKLALAKLKGEQDQEKEALKVTYKKELDGLKKSQESNDKLFKEKGEVELHPLKIENVPEMTNDQSGIIMPFIYEGQ